MHLAKHLYQQHQHHDNCLSFPLRSVSAHTVISLLPWIAWLPSCSASPLGKTGRSEGLWSVTHCDAELQGSCQANLLGRGLVLSLPPDVLPFPFPGPIFSMYAHPSCECKW